MKTIFQCVVLAIVLAYSTSVLAAAPVPNSDAVQTMAKKDRQAELDRVASTARSDQSECDKRAGPAAKACSIQAEGKRWAAEEEAKMSFDRRTALAPASREQQKTVAKQEIRRAKVNYDIAKARIRNDRNAALVECEKLKRDERKTCETDVALRTADAEGRSRSAYNRAIGEAKSDDTR